MGRLHRKGTLAFSSTLKTYWGRPVDLVTDKALREEIRPYVEREIVNE